MVFPTAVSLSSVFWFVQWLGHGVVAHVGNVSFTLFQLVSFGLQSVLLFWDVDSGH